MRGIGVGVVEVFYDVGWDVIVVGILEIEIVQFSGSLDIEFKLLDVINDVFVSVLFLELQLLDVLVNCVGIFVCSWEYELDVFQKVIDVNLMGIMCCCLVVYLLL